MRILLFGWIALPTCLPLHWKSAVALLLTLAKSPFLTVLQAGFLWAELRFLVGHLRLLLKKFYIKFLYFDYDLQRFQMKMCIWMSTPTKTRKPSSMLRYVFSVIFTFSQFNDGHFRWQAWCVHWRDWAMSSWLAICKTMTNPVSSPTSWSASMLSAFR